jgi:hypothetical protein
MIGSHTASTRRGLAVACLLGAAIGSLACGGSGSGPEPTTPPVLDWTTLGALPAARINAVAAAPGNGHVYLFNGFSSDATCKYGTADGRVFSAPVAADGTLGAWAEGTAGTAGFSRSLAGVAVANGYIYTAGGAIDSPTWDGAVWFARASADGSLSAWAAATHPAPAWIGSSALMSAWDGVLYAGGGLNAHASPAVSQVLYAAPLDAATGQPGSWVTASTLPVATLNGQLAFASGRAYLLPGGTDQIYLAPVQADHTLGSWTLATARLPGKVSFPHLAAVNGKLVVIRGGSTDVWASTLQPDGSPGPWSSLVAAPAALSPLNQAALVGRRLYVFGNSDCGAAVTAAASAAYISPDL